MTLITFVQVFTVCLLGAMSPGPSMAVVINNAIFKGRYNGILTSIGHGIGITVYATFAVLGLGLIIKTNIFIFEGLKILSIIFLIFIGVKSIFNKEKFDFVFYIAGVDVHFNDRLGKLKISDEGIKKRDEMVTQNFFSKGVPLCGVLGGGYNKSFDKLIELHSMLHKNCAEYF